MTLALKDVSLLLGKKQVLENVSFTVARGELIGLIGPNGAGKSTLLKACAGILPLQKGEIDMCQQKLVDVTPTALAAMMAYLPQDREINWPIPVSSLVSLGVRYGLGMRARLSDCDFKAINKAMKALDIAHLKNRPANQLSGGEKAAVLMARALAQEPKLLLADEPAAGLDPGHALSLMGHLKKMSAEGMTVIVVMHDLTLAGQFCDRLICLHKGRVANMGRANRVLSATTLKDVYGVKAEKIRAGNKDLYIPTTTL